VNGLLDGLRGGLIVSVQAEAASLLNTPETIALLARCAVQNGATAVRIEGTARIAAVRAALPDVPIIGIVKRSHPGFEPYITSTREEIAGVAAAGATIVAFDATLRPRAGGMRVADAVACARAAGLVAMADCSCPEDAAAAAESGAGILATTLAGYTAATAGRPLPALDLVAAIAARHPFAVCEGGIGAPEGAEQAFAAGASAVVVGTAITNVDALVRRFAAATPRGRP
jgi:N-acylglucosamine-6-phosphate 2-epimerase